MPNVMPMLTGRATSKPLTCLMLVIFIQNRMPQRHGDIKTRKPLRANWQYKISLHVFHFFFKFLCVSVPPWQSYFRLCT